MFINFAKAHRYIGFCGLVISFVHSTAGEDLILSDFGSGKRQLVGELGYRIGSRFPAQIVVAEDSIKLVSNGSDATAHVDQMFFLERAGNIQRATPGRLSSLSQTELVLIELVGTGYDYWPGTLVPGARVASKTKGDYWNIYLVLESENTEFDRQLKSSRPTKPISFSTIKDGRNGLVGRFGTPLGTVLRGTVEVFDIGNDQHKIVLTSNNRKVELASVDCEFRDRVTRNGRLSTVEPRDLTNKGVIQGALLLEEIDMLSEMRSTISRQDSSTTAREQKASEVKIKTIVVIEGLLSALRSN